MAIDPKLGFQIGNAGINLASSLFGAPSGGEQAYQTGAAAFSTAQQMQHSAIDFQGNLYDQQANIAMSEAAEAARIKAREGKQFAEQQALTYSGNGVLLAGTPMKVVNDTRAEARKEVEYLMRAGAAQANMFRTQKMIMQNNGRAQMLSAQMTFNAQRAQAAMAQAAQRSGSLQSALTQLGGIFGGTYSPYTAPNTKYPQSSGGSP